jgi:hypothetical protein
MKRLIRMGLFALPLACSGVALAQAADAITGAGKQQATDAAKEKANGILPDKASPTEEAAPAEPGEPLQPKSDSAQPAKPYDQGKDALERGKQLDNAKNVTP